MTVGLVVVAWIRSADDDGKISIARPVEAPRTAGTGSTGDAESSSPNSDSIPTTASTTPPTTVPQTALTTPTTTTLVAVDTTSSADRSLVEGFTVTDADLQPKSIVASGNGLFFAQNMMYRHNVAIYDTTGAKVATIPDEVDLAAFGVAGGVVAQGSPVEAAFTPDGQFVYVSNYKMFGPGFNPVADDGCNEGDWDDSFVYKIDTTSFEIVAVVPTGAVPKFLAVSPDGATLVVSNWCGFDVSIIDTATDTEIGRVDVGRHPRGIAIRGDSEYAYVTVMGEARVDVIDLGARAVVNTVPNVGTTPRHALLSTDDQFLYISNHTMNSVRKIDLNTGGVVGIAETGAETRTMALSDDGDSLYVVNYQDGTISKVRTSDMAILQTLQSGVHPVGITYDPATRQVWVANYAGTLRVFVDQ